MRKKIFFIIAGVALLVIAGFFALGFGRLFSAVPTPIVLHGNIDDRQIKVPFQIAERIESIRVEEGDHIKKDELLGTLESIRIHHQLRSAIASRDSAKANLEKLVNGSREEDIQIARAEVEAVKAKLKAAELHHARESHLAQVNAISQRDADTAEADCMMFRAMLRGTENNLRKLLNGSRKEDIAAAQAQLAQAEVQVAIEKQKLRDCRLLAPCDAIVRNRILEPGEMASPQTPALVLAIVSPKWVRTYLPEFYLPRIRNGEKALVEVDGAPGKTFEGWVGFISPNAEFTPKNVETPEIRTSLVYEVRVFVKDPENRLKLGGPATVTFPESLLP